MQANECQFTIGDDELLSAVPFPEKNSQAPTPLALANYRSGESRNKSQEPKGRTTGQQQLKMRKQSAVKKKKEQTKIAVPS